MNKFLSFSLLVFLCSCGGQDAKQEEWKKLTALQEQKEKEVAKKYAATSFPPEEYTNHAVFTYDLEKRLTRADEQPTLFTVFVEDLVQGDNGLQLEATAFLSHRSCCDQRQVKLILNAQEDQVLQVLNKIKDKAGMNAYTRPRAFLVAKISSLQKSDDTTGLQTRFVAKGNLIALEETL